MSEDPQKKLLPEPPLASDMRELATTTLPAPALDVAVLDSLLELSIELLRHPPTDERSFACRFADKLSELLPELAIGVKLADPKEPFLECRVASGATSGEGVSRQIFPSMAYEEAFELDIGSPDSELLIASDDPSLSAENSPLAQLLKRAAELLSAAIHRSRSARHSETEELQSLRSQVIQSEKLGTLGQLVVGVAHELNNPLSTVTIYSAYLMDKAQSGNYDPEDLERLGRIREAADRMQELSRDLMAYARPSMELSLELHLPEVLEKALTFCEHELTVQAISVEKRYPPKLPPVRGIKSQLTQVFVNLITNATYAMRDRGGKLEIGIYVDPTGMLCVDVSDDGQGIDTPDLERIFDPFFSTKGEGEGTGLGLSIVRDIIVAHEGRVEAQSAPGAGSCFSVWLPQSSSRPFAE